MAKNNGFLFLYEWVNEMRELDGETFKRIFFAIVDYFQTQNKTTVSSADNANVLNLIHQSKQAGI